MKRVIAIGFSDLHLTLRTPLCRAEKDWLAVQARYLHEVEALRYRFECPVLFGGDLFDRWDAAPELIEFAYRHLPKDMLCVPGQHDLPNHRLDQAHRSGYGVLRTVGRITDLSGRKVFSNQDITVVGYGWGEDLEPPELSPAQAKRPLVAIAHRYVGYKQYQHPNAPADVGLDAIGKHLDKTFDAALFGDNHLGWAAMAGECSVINCGGFIRRKSDEFKYSPSIGLLSDDGEWSRYYLTTDEDEFVPEVSRPNAKPSIDMGSFLDELQELGEQGLDFEAAVKQYLEHTKPEPAVRELIMTSLYGNAD